jgi:Transposase DDE domain
MAQRGCFLAFYPFMPIKLRATIGDHRPRWRYRITSWRAHEAGLRNRGSLAVWFSKEAVAAWKGLPSGKQGGQPRYSELAIDTALTLRLVFRLALRQCEGLIGSIMHLQRKPAVKIAVRTLTRMAEPGPACLRPARLKPQGTGSPASVSLHATRSSSMF